MEPGVKQLIFVSTSKNWNMIMMASLGVHVHEACIGMRALVYASGGGLETSIGLLSVINCY